MAPLSPKAAAAIARLRAFKPPPTHYHSLPLTRRAAVLILLFADKRGDLRVVLTIRAAKLKNYAGHAALPGGKADLLTETPWQTARREAYEEIGLPLHNSDLPPGYSVEHLTELPSNLAMTELGVRPCVAYLRSEAEGQGRRDGDPAKDLLPTLDAKEVAAVFTAPFHNFLAPVDEDETLRQKIPGHWYTGTWHSWHEEDWRMHQFFVPVPSRSNVLSRQPSHPGPAAPEVQKGGKELSPRPEPVPELGGVDRAANSAVSGDPLDQPRYRVFGMTARILVDAARVAYGEEPGFEHNSHFGDEDMIHRLMRMGRLGPVKKEGEHLSRDVMVKAAKI